ncbi:MAG: HD domain-containing protein [Bacteriovoracaceae bacterium]|nr:HD domain-containing protein [Bacteriovoracaceae bacterium]
MKILILEQTIELSELIGLYLSSLNSCEIVTATSDEDALAKLKQSGFQVFILNQKFTTDSLKSAYDYARDKSPETQIVLIGEGEAGVKANYVIQSSNLVHEIKSMVKAPFWRSISGKPADLPLPLSPYLVFRLGVCPADLFLKLGENNWVKLFHKGSPFGEEEKRKFEAKGLKEFYILTDDVKQAMGHFEDLLSALKATSTIEDAPLIADSNEFIWHAMKEHGFREEINRVAQEAIRQSLALVRKEPEVKKFIEKIFRPEHAWMVRHNLIITHVACAIASELGWISEQTFIKIATASMLHDMALPRLDQDEEIWMMSVQGERMREGLDKEMKDFLQHPIEGAQQIRRHKSIPPDTDKIILEHHEMPDGTGFPRALSASQISPLGAVFILSHAIATILIHEGDPAKWKMSTLKQKLVEERWQVGHFKKAWQAFEKTELFP